MRWFHFFICMKRTRFVIINQSSTQLIGLGFSLISYFILNSHSLAKFIMYNKLGLISSIEISAPMAIEKIKILGAVLELPAKKHCQFSPFGPFSLWIGWIGSAGSSKTALRILIFSMAMGADYSFELISIETYPPNLLDIIKFVFFKPILKSQESRPVGWNKSWRFKFPSYSAYIWHGLGLILTDQRWFFWTNSKSLLHSGSSSSALSHASSAHQCLHLMGCLRPGTSWNWLR